jgi:peptide/nickel transport system permease protein
MAGTRLAVIGPVVIAAGSAVLGSILGLFSGYFRGRVDGVVMRWVDFMYALPALLVTLVIVGVTGGGYWLAVALLTVLTVPYDTRLIRGATLQQRNLPYVEAAEMLGVGPARIMARHIWPNLLGVIIPNSCLNFAFGLSGLASLSFLGIGSPPGSDEWGRMVFENSATLFQNAWGVFAPAMMIVFTAVVMNLLGDYFYEKLSDRGAG